MRVLFDGRMKNNSGIGRIIQNFISFLPDTEDVFVIIITNECDIESQINNCNLEIRKLKIRIPIYSLKEQIMLPLEISKIAPDIIHFPNFNFPILEKSSFIVTINDLVYYLFPESCPSALGHLYARYMMREAIKRAKKVITISNYSKLDLLKNFRITERKIAVIYPGVDTSIYHKIEDKDLLQKCKEKYGIKKKFIFYAGTHSERKNLLRLIEAFSLLKNARDYNLVIGGKIDLRRKKLYKFAGESGLKDNILFTDLLSEEDLVLFYNMAEVFVFPSLYEGFGLPPIEAMACGTPVICSNTSSLPEVVGDAALLFDPTDTQEIKQAIEDILENNDLRNNLIEKGRNRVSDFKWSETVKNFIQLYKENEIS